MTWVLIAAVASYLGFRFWAWHKSRTPRSVTFVTPNEAARAVSSNNAVIYDVRSHNYYDAKAIRVKGSLRLDPNAIHRWEDTLPRDKPVYLYCT